MSSFFRTTIKNFEFLQDLVVMKMTQKQHLYFAILGYNCDITFFIPFQPVSTGNSFKKCIVRNVECNIYLCQLIAVLCVLSI